MSVTTSYSFQLIVQSRNERFSIYLNKINYLITQSRKQQMQSFNAQSAQQ